MIRDIKLGNATGYEFHDLRDDDGKFLSDISAVDTATGMSYYSCVAVCRDTSRTWTWIDVAQKAGTWVLPSLAIMAQLPFGAHSSLDDWGAVVLTIGCPALAAYSLALTVLNGQWITRQFEGITFGAASDAVRCLRSLQQTPIKLGPKGLLASLVVLPCNDQYWHTLAHKLDKQDSTWTIPAIISVGWVVLAYLLTIVTSSAQVKNAVDGLAIGAAWCFLLAVVTGWLIVSPKCNARRNAHCLREANAIARVAPENIADHSTPQSVCIETDAVYPKHRAFELIEEPDTLLVDQMSSQPLYNYARYHTWTAISLQVHQYYRNAHFQRFHGITAHGGQYDSGDDGRNRFGTNSQILSYCEEDKYSPAYALGGRSEDWLIACGLALSLQWGTIGAAVLAFVLTPTTGLGCRSLAYLIYGGVATVVWIMFLISGWLTHRVFSRANTLVDFSRGSSHRIALYRFLSITLRRLAKLFATINALGFVVICFLHFTRKFSTCYCNSSVIGRGASRAYDMVIWNDGTAAIKHMKNGFLGSIILSLGCGVCFIIFLRSSLKPRRISESQP
ncbi:hypothetical protein DL96DRAFT_1532771 [Flagelloscypha sp. PMI_526]|nr:hypothetical protein DL96DRAFT_1532771 [Flagelloscypha sp. PMI_526]